MKRLVVVVLVMVLAIPVMAGGLEFVAKKWFNDEPFDVRFGVASYTDSYGGTGGALYVQTPVVQWSDLWLSFGGVFPVENMDRSRPEFSLATSVGCWVDCPKWMNWELGVYVAASPYEAWGGQVGLVNMRF